MYSAIHIVLNSCPGFYSSTKETKMPRELNLRATL